MSLNGEISGFDADLFTVTYSTDDNTAKPVIYYQKSEYQVDFVEANWVTYSSSFGITPDEKGTIHAKAVDSVSNISAVVKKSYIVDGSAPVVSVENPEELAPAENNGWIVVALWTQKMI